MTPTEVQEVRRHLAELLSSELADSEVQGAVLTAIVEAKLRGEVPRGKDLAKEVYQNPRYVKALQASVRELRHKLVQVYTARRPSAVRFKLPEKGYAIRFEWGSEPDAPRNYVLAPRADGRLVRRLAGAAVVLSAAVVAVWLSTSTGHPVVFPEAVEHTEEAIKLLDESGNELTAWEPLLAQPLGIAPVPGPELQAAQATLISREPVGYQDVALATCDVTLPYGCEVHWFSLEDQTLLSTYSPLPELGDASRKSLSLHDRDGAIIDPHFRALSIEAIELDGDGRRDELLLAFGSDRLFPTQVLGLDLSEDWRILFEHWNMGKVAATALPDTNGDGIDEVVVYGSNNAHQRALLTVLTSEMLRSEPRSRSVDGPRGTILREVAMYPVGGFTLLFPISELGGSWYPTSILRNDVRELEWDPDTLSMKVDVRDAANDPNNQVPLHMWFTLDFLRGDVSVELRDHDMYLRELLRLMETDKVEDQWRIVETERLGEYEDWLAARVRCFSGAVEISGADCNLAAVLTR